MSAMTAGIGRELWLLTKWTLPPPRSLQVGNDGLRRSIGSFEIRARDRNRTSLGNRRISAYVDFYFTHRFCRMQTSENKEMHSGKSTLCLLYSVLLPFLIEAVYENWESGTVEPLLSLLLLLLLSTTSGAMLYYVTTFTGSGAKQHNQMNLSVMSNWTLLVLLAVYLLNFLDFAYPCPLKRKRSVVSLCRHLGCWRDRWRQWKLNSNIFTTYLWHPKSSAIDDHHSYHSLWWWGDCASDECFYTKR